jgi:hypothetical protein
MSKGCGKRARVEVRTNEFGAPDPRDPMFEGMPCDRRRSGNVRASQGRRRVRGDGEHNLVDEGRPMCEVYDPGAKLRKGTRRKGERESAGRGKEA